MPAPMQVACPICQSTRIMPDGLSEERIKARLSWLPGYKDEAGVWHPCSGLICIDGHTCENGHRFYLISEKGKPTRYSLTRE